MYLPGRRFKRARCNARHYRSTLIKGSGEALPTCMQEWPPLWGGRSDGAKNVAKWPYGSLLTGRKGRCYSGPCT